MQRLEVSGAVRPIYGSLGVKRLRYRENVKQNINYFLTKDRASRGLKFCLQCTRKHAVLALRKFT